MKCIILMVFLIITQVGINLKVPALAHNTNTSKETENVTRKRSYDTLGDIVNILL